MGWWACARVMHQLTSKGEVCQISIFSATLMESVVPSPNPNQQLKVRAGWLTLAWRRVIGYVEPHVLRWPPAAISCRPGCRNMPSLQLISWCCWQCDPAGQWKTWKNMLHSVKWLHAKGRPVLHCRYFRYLHSIDNSLHQASQIRSLHLHYWHR